jgi:hypothetical protein
LDTAHDHTVKVCNSLTETTLDRANGKDAAENAPSSQITAMFARAALRTELITQLLHEVSAFGGIPGPINHGRKRRNLCRRPEEFDHGSQ